MVNFLIGPQGFIGIDSIFEAISIIVSFLVAIFAYKVYKMTSQKKYLNFSIAFLLISLALSFKIISNFVYFYKTVEQSFYGLFTITYRYNFDFVNIIASFLYRFLMLIAFTMLLVSVLRVKDKRLVFLLMVFSFLLVILSFNSYFIFHLLLVLILGFISYHSFDNYRTKKSRGSMLVMTAFMVLLISQFVFVFQYFTDELYGIGESLLLIGFLLILTEYILILRK